MDILDFNYLVMSTSLADKFQNGFKESIEKCSAGISKEYVMIKNNNSYFSLMSRSIKSTENFTATISNIVFQFVTCNSSQ